MIVTGSNGYILENFNFKIFSKNNDLFFIHSSKKKDLKISYNEEDLEFLKKNIVSRDYSQIILISFGSHLGGADPGLYFKSVENLNSLLKSLVKQKKKFSYIMPHLLHI